MQSDELVPKVTIVSVLPFILTERKPGQIPGYYEIARAPAKGTLGITHITDAWFPELIPFADTKAPARRIDISAEKVADGIVNDYIGSCLAVSHDIADMETGARRLPGLFWVHGIWSGSDLIKREAGKVNQATINTIAWFEALVKLADDSWQKYHQHIMITDLQRNACSYLGFKDREWNVNVVEQMAATVSCPSCFSSVNKNAIKCYNCSYILDLEKYEQNKARFAIT